MTLFHQMEMTLQGISPTKLPTRPRTTPAPAIDVFPSEMMHALHGEHRPTKPPSKGSGPHALPYIIIE